MKILKLGSVGKKLGSARQKVGSKVTLMLRVSTLRFGWSFSWSIRFYLNPFWRGVECEIAIE